jgi:hypothetical protein
MMSPPALDRLRRASPQVGKHRLGDRHSRMVRIHGIRSSARVNNDRGKVMPIALAVLRLIT